MRKTPTERYYEELNLWVRDQVHKTALRSARDLLEEMHKFAASHPDLSAQRIVEEFQLAFPPVPEDSPQMPTLF